MYENIEELITVYWKALWDAFHPSQKTHCFLSHSKYFMCSKWSHDIHFWLGKKDLELDQQYVVTSGCIVQLNYSCDNSKKRKENGKQIYIILGSGAQYSCATLIKQTDKAEAVWDVLIWENIIRSKIKVTIIQAADVNNKIVLGLCLIKSYCKTGDLLSIVQLNWKFWKEITEANPSMLDVLCIITIKYINYKKVTSVVIAALLSAKSQHWI